MKTRLFLMSFLIGSMSLMWGQTTINVKISSALDDHEERISGALPQSGTVGDMIVASTALELGNETGTTNPQLVGLRFANVSLPAHATIMDAYIQFTVKGTSKNTDPCSLNIFVENSANALTFSDNAMSLSGRSLVVGSISWPVSGASWATVGSATADQRTPSIKTLIQPLVHKTGWSSGNGIAFFIKGTGTREVHAFESDPTKVAELVVTYSVAGATGIQELNKTASVNVYPNPFKNAFTVSKELTAASDVVISVYDLSGKLVEEKLIKQAAAGAFHYTSTAELTAGMYFVKVQANNTQEVLKLVSE